MLSNRSLNSWGTEENDKIKVTFRCRHRIQMPTQFCRISTICFVADNFVDVNSFGRKKFGHLVVGQITAREEKSFCLEKVSENLFFVFDNKFR